MGTAHSILIFRWIYQIEEERQDKHLNINLLWILMILKILDKTTKPRKVKYYLKRNGYLLIL